jgi:hypothetical protein
MADADPNSCLGRAQAQANPPDIFETITTVQSPTGALANVSEAMADAIRATAIVEGMVAENIPDAVGFPADIGLISAKSDILALTYMLRRDLLRSQALIDAAWRALLEQKHSPVRRHVELATGIDDRAFEHAMAELAKADGKMSGLKGDAAIDAAADATCGPLRRAIEAPTRTIRNLKRKVELIRRELGDFVVDGAGQGPLAAILDDLDRIQQTPAAAQEA